MNKIYTFLCALSFVIGGSFDAQSAAGDTTLIQAHNEVHWDWNGNFYDTVSFPTTNTYQKVIMHYVLGCPSIGCSGWDYTTQIAIWDENNPDQKFELAKVITPYAGDKNQGWYHEYKFDVTHLLPILNGNKVINARYDGWQDGFTISVFFEFIEGTAPRTPLQVNSVYHTYATYGDNSNPINAQLAEDTIALDPAADHVTFQMSATGHGFGNNNGAGTNPENCAEFCDKWYGLLVNGSQRYQQTVWRNDCGSEPLYAQTGTWVYNRAGWCPGSESQVFVHDISGYVSGADFRVKVNWENYVANNVSMGYNVSGMVTQWGPLNYQTDAEVYDVLNPSNYDRYSRYNPTAKAPTIVLRNNGANTMYSCKIKYGVQGGTFYTTTWQGVLKTGEMEETTLPIPPHNFFKGSTAKVFIAEILEVNGAADENATNNTYRSAFENIDQINGKFTLKVKTNNVAADNWYIVTATNGDTVLFRDNLTNNTEYVDTLDLPDGTYTYYIEDAGGDGLAWWANTQQGNGTHQFRNVGVPGSQPPTFIKNFDPDFGNFYVKNFSIGYDIVAGNPNYDEKTWTPPATVGIAKTAWKPATGLFEVFPVPASNFVHIKSLQISGKTLIQVFNQQGAMVFQSYKNMSVDGVETINIEDWASGIYFVSLSGDGKTETLKMVK